MTMREVNPEFINDFVGQLVQEGTIADSDSAAIAEAWRASMAEASDLRTQLAITGAYREQLGQLGPEGATPAKILSGEYGPEAQQEFLRGAFRAIELLMTTRLEPIENNTEEK
jgi:hypothetical protein